MKGGDAAVTWLLLTIVCEMVFANAEMKVPAKEDPEQAHRELNIGENRASADQEGAGKEFEKPVETTNSIGMTLRLIPEGDFLMGSSYTAEDIVRIFHAFERDAKIFANEHPKHRVCIRRPYYLGVTEVTQSQWVSVMGTRPWRGNENVRKGPHRPAVCISWEDAVEFCRRLSNREGATYRLPSEAEWEYACRAGTTAMYSFGKDAAQLGDNGWWGGASGDGNCIGEEYAHRVGQKRSNPFGLHDIHGNVWEWCQDWYDGDYYDDAPTNDPLGPNAGKYRVIRGGGWEAPARFHRSASRYFGSPTLRGCAIGFRVAQQSSAVPR